MLANILFLVLIFGRSSTSNWIINEDFQYLINTNNKVDWDTAVKECKAEEAELLTLTSESETKFISSNCEKCRFWLALENDAQNQNELERNLGAWTNMDTQRGDCIEMNNDILYSRDCMNLNGYICKKIYIPAIAEKKRAQVIISNTLQTTIGEVDPCWSYVGMFDKGVREPNNAIFSSLLCDVRLKANWYRFNSSAGNRMPMSCVPPQRCGTLEPVWMNGKLPTASDAIVTRKACVSAGTDCCASSWDIKVKKCPGYYVYYLPPVNKCFRAYCIGFTQQDCLQCDFAKFPTLYKQPTLTWRIVNSKIEFVCDIIYELEPPEGQFEFEVQWFADQIKIHQTILRPDTLQAVFKPSYNGIWGKLLTCQVRGRFDQGPFSPTKSVTFFAGVQIINPESSIIVKPGKVTQINFKLTLPLICSSEVTKDCQIQIFAGLDVDEHLRCSNQMEIVEAVIKSPFQNLDESFCGITITNENWNSTHELLLAGTIHPQFTTRKQAKLQLFTFDLASKHSRKRDLQIIDCDFFQEIGLTIEGLNLVNNFCYSLNDPHMRTFDNIAYEHHLRGTFLLYRNKKSKFEVRTYYDYCVGNTQITCNCAVVIKACDSWYIIDRCQNNMMLPSGDIILGEAWCGDIVVNKLDEGRKFEFTLPTGVKVEVLQSYHNLIDIYIRASAFDFGFTEGLCGTFNDDSSDDFTLRNGFVACTSNAGHCPTFSQNWKISDDRSGLFEGFDPDVLRIVRSNQAKTHTADIFCKCSINKGKLEKQNCNYNSNFQPCGNPRGKVITPVIKHIENVKNVDFDIEILRQKEQEMLEKSKQNTHSWTKDEARKFCKESLQKSSAGKFCKNIPNVEFDPKIDFCIIDIMMTNSTVFVQSAVESVKEECMTELNRNTSLWVPSKNPVTGENIFILPPDIDGQLCINDCNNLGTCINGVCKCKEGYIGGDCSIKSNQPPEILYIPKGGICDKHIKPCESAAVYGLNFVDGDKLTCHIETLPINMPNSGIFSQGKSATKVKALFQSFGEVQCPIPVNTINSVIDRWVIYISNNGQLKSLDGALFTIYNSQCINCGPNATCNQKENTCIIGGECFQSGAVNTITPCKVCKPENSPNQWTAGPECISTNKPTTENPEFICPASTDIFPHPKLCSHFIICKNWIAISIACQHPLYYNPKRHRCDIPSAVPTCKNGVWL